MIHLQSYVHHPTHNVKVLIQQQQQQLNKNTQNKNVNKIHTFSLQRSLSLCEWLCYYFNQHEF